MSSPSQRRCILVQCPYGETKLWRSRKLNSCWRVCIQAVEDAGDGDRERAGVSFALLLSLAAPQAHAAEKESKEGLKATIEGEVREMSDAGDRIWLNVVIIPGTAPVFMSW